MTWGDSDICRINQNIMWISEASQMNAPVSLTSSHLKMPNVWMEFCEDETVASVAGRLCNVYILNQFYNTRAIVLNYFSYELGKQHV